MSLVEIITIVAASLIVIGVIVARVRRRIKNKKAGIVGCCDCSECSHCQGCRYCEELKKKAETKSN